MENVPSSSGKKRLRLDSITSQSDIDNQDDAGNDSSLDSSSSDSSIEIKNKRHPQLLDSDSDSSESDWDITPSQTQKSRLPQLDEDSSSESDGQSDKCPICLAKFKGQEIGSPDSCDHSFCYECILEWSKNVTTCPIDRQQFQLILVKKHLDGGIVRQTPVHAQQTNEADVESEDPTFCEVCGSCEREDRLLLCDGCDLGYHLECLTPALSEVPMGSWLCPDCAPLGLQQDITIYVDELEVLYHDAEEIGPPANARRTTRNVVPRTRQSDRIRARIISNRNNRISTVVEHHNIQVEVDQASSSRPRTSQPKTTVRRKKKTTRTKPKGTKRKRKTKKTSSSRSRIQITYEIDEETGKTLVIKTKSTLRRRNKKKVRTKRKRLQKAIDQQKTAKRRLAKHFGICAPKQPGQTLPDMRVPCDNKNLTYLRGQAGIPSLSLFGNRDELDCFSASDDEDEDIGGYGVSAMRARRRPNLSDAAIFRRNAARKSVLLPQVSQPSSSSVDILGSIMDSQEKMYSKHSVLSLNKDGSLKIDTNKNIHRDIDTNRNLTCMENRNKRIDVNDRRNMRMRYAPTYSPSDNSSNVGNNINSQDYRNATTTGNISNSNSNSIASSSSDAAATSFLSHDPGNSGSEQDIYSDIETVSTTKVGAEDSDKEEALLEGTKNTKEEKSDKAEEYPDIDILVKEPQEEDVSSTTNVLVHSDGPDCSVENTDDEECPNFSIYSKDTLNLVANRNPEQDEVEVGSSLDIKQTNNENLDEEEEPPPPPMTDEEDEDEEKHEKSVQDESKLENCENSNSIEKLDENQDNKDKNETNSSLENNTLDETNAKISDDVYTDSEDENEKLTKTNDNKSFGIVDIRSLTEDISEEERSYTPCLDERVPTREGLEGLDTEAISEDEKDFDESHEHKTVSDGGDALEINAKESELDFTKPDDYEEGEIVDKLKKIEDAKKSEENKIKPKLIVKEREEPTSEPASASFKRISKNTKDRNYRDKERDRSRSHSRDKNKENERERKRERKREKRKELERYNVRNLMSDKPKKPQKDKFGRDARRRSRSGSSRSLSYSSPYRSPSRGRRSVSRDRRKRRGRSRGGRSTSRSRSRSRRRSLSKKRRSFSRSKRRRSIEERNKKKKNRSVSRHRSRTPSPRRSHRDWENQRSRAWTPSLSRSRSPDHRGSPSWTPPRIHENSSVKPHNLTVILTNDSKKKKDKRKTDRKKKEAVEKTKKRKRDKTPIPSKEVFASGDNILVSVSFNKDGEELAKRTKQREPDEVSTKRTRKEKEKRTRTPPPKPKKKKQLLQDLSAVKPVAIIDLDRSPFKELTPSPKDVIVLSDSDHSPEKAVPDSSQQADYLGPKTPPEPQVKFSLAPKAPQLRQINNPLHDPDDEHEENDIDPQVELEQRLIEALHKGPNTPSDPPNSPPSSPDAYDPFDPTKSRSPTPDTEKALNNVQKSELADNTPEKEKIPLSKTPEPVKSHTPPLILTDIQREPADSQSNSSVTNTDEPIDPKPNQNTNAQGNSPIFNTKAKPLPPNITSTPTSAIVTTPRVNILNSTIITPVPAQVPRIIPNITKPPPLKPSPTKASVKLMPKRLTPGTSTSKMVPKAKNNRSTDSNDSNMDLDSPSSPGPSDFDDLFEPPSEHKPTCVMKPKPTTTNKPPNKIQSTFDTLFGSTSPVSKNKTPSKDKNKRPPHPKIKQVGVKFDEDSLKILDELPNSAVEMQVKDKFLKKLNRQERVVEEVKLVLKPHYNKKHISKEEYKDILRRAVPKICHNKAGEINPKKIHSLIEAYVKKLRQSKKVSSSSSVGAQK